MVKVLRGFPCIITPRNSGVNLHVREGLFGVILGNIYEKFSVFNHLIKESDCIVGPLCEFEFHSYDDISKGAWMKIEVPHIVRNPNVESRIKVISRDRYLECIEYAQRLEPGEEPPDYENIYYCFHERHIEIFTHHLSQFIVYAENISLEELATPPSCCTRYLEILMFEKWIRDKDDQHPEVTAYICSLQNQKVFINFNIMHSCSI